MAIVGIIPARFGSTRLAGKPLSDIHGKTLIERVHERPEASRTRGRVIVATDDERIASAVRGFDGEAVMTASSRPTGTGRLAEATGARAEAVAGDLERVRALLAPQKGRVA